MTLPYFPHLDVLNVLRKTRRDNRSDARIARSEPDNPFNVYRNVLRIAMRPVKLPPTTQEQRVMDSHGSDA